MLRATTTIEVPGSAALLTELCDHFVEHGEVSRKGEGADVSFGYGRAVFRILDTGLEVAAEAGNEINLSYVKMGVVEHVLEMASGPVSTIVWQGQGQASGLPLFFREMRVVSTRRLTPNMQRLRLAGRDLQRFRDEGLHVGLLFPPKGRAPVWPTIGADGRMVWPGGEDRIHRRVYTLRAVDPAAGHVDIDMVIHEGEGMPGADFAREAKAGDLVGMTGPGGGRVPDAQALFLFGDETALPAIARILAERPLGSRTHAAIEVPERADCQALANPSGAQIHWLVRGEGAEGLGQTALATDFESLGPDPFVWAGCEFADFKAIRVHCRKTLRMTRERHLVAAYWRRGKSGEERFGDE